jgi:hypothetical protein
MTILTALQPVGRHPSAAMILNTFLLVWLRTRPRTKMPMQIAKMIMVLKIVNCLDALI